MTSGKGRITPGGRARRIISWMCREGFQDYTLPNPKWDELEKLIAKEFRSQRDADNSKWREREREERITEVYGREVC